MMVVGGFYLDGLYLDGGDLADGGDRPRMMESVELKDV